MPRFYFGNTIIALFLCLGIPATLLFNGFCLSSTEHTGGKEYSRTYHVSFLSNEDAVNAVIDSIIAGRKPTLSRQEFRMLHPDCCKVVWMNIESISERLLGQAAKEVRVDLADGGDRLHYTISNCGRVRFLGAYFR
jgi:hypothetical protein